MEAPDNAVAIGDHRTTGFFAKRINVEKVSVKGLQVEGDFGILGRLKKTDDFPRPVANQFLKFDGFQDFEEEDKSSLQLLALKLVDFRYILDTAWRQKI